MNTGVNNSKWKPDSGKAILLIGAVAGISFLIVSLSAVINDVEAQGQERRPNVITIIGTTNNEEILIDEEDADSEICSNFPVVVRGSGVTSMGQIPSCQDNPNLYGWDISPNPNGIDTIQARGKWHI